MHTMFKAKMAALTLVMNGTAFLLYHEVALETLTIEIFNLEIVDKI